MTIFLFIFSFFQALNDAPKYIITKFQESKRQMSFEHFHNMDNKLAFKNKMNDLSHQKVPNNLIEEGISVLDYTNMVISPRSFLKCN